MVLVDGEFSEEKQYKILIVGEPACGKSSLVLRYCHDEFSRQYYPTGGVDVFLKRTLVEAQSVRLVIWDISGNALSSTLLDKYLYGAHAVLLTFDITNSTSFVALPAWYNAVLNITSSSSLGRPLISVIANKCDIEHQRAVPLDKQRKFVNENRLFLHSVSTRTGDNVALTFQRIIASLLGIKLSKLEIEANQKVVKAEVFVSHPHQHNTSTQTPSSICTIQ
ncbi:ras-related protein Rab-28-like isoform X2 [Planococcus citri]|uniref:ras-related protein Rab-28-like isoform X2 n=1 Tax=Planococcus citri TaxID=170843 RepID=UPI0031F9D588